MTQHDRDHAITRRRALQGLAGTGAGLAGARLLGGLPLGASPALAAACTLTPEATEGPYYLDLEKIRKNITEGKAGLRLDLHVTVVDSTSCKPIEGVAVDIWHCDAVGVYSGFGAEGTSGKTFLRGVRLSDSDGLASFRTIYPGWYRGRATHIHLKAHVGGSAGAGRYSGGHVAHTGQLFFSDTTTDRVARLSPYTRNAVTRTRNREDNIYSGQHGASTVLHLKRRKAGTIKSGFVAAITLGIDPDATPSAV
jgi:protocatechuate 3,4-dioxygenase beta subunit